MDYSYNSVPTYSYGAGSSTPGYNPAPIAPIETYNLPGSSIPSAPVSTISSPNPVVYPSPSASVPTAPVSVNPQTPGPQIVPTQPAQYPLQQEPVPIQASPYLPQPLPNPVQSDAYVTPLTTPSAQSTPYVSQPLPTPDQTGAYAQQPGLANNTASGVDSSQLVTVNIVNPEDPSSQPFTDVTLSSAFVFLSFIIHSPELVYCPQCHKNVMTKVQNTSLYVL